MTNAELVALLKRMRDVIWTEGEYALSLHDVNATIDALKSGAVVLVPGEPTDAMCGAGADAIDCGLLDEDEAEKVYRAMLAAAKEKP